MAKWVIRTCFCRGTLGGTIHTSEDQSGKDCLVVDGGHNRGPEKEVTSSRQHFLSRPGWVRSSPGLAPYPTLCSSPLPPTTVRFIPAMPVYEPDCEILAA